MELLGAIIGLCLFISSYFIGKWLLNKIFDVGIEATDKVVTTVQKKSAPVIAAIKNPHAICASYKLSDFIRAHGPKIIYESHVAHNGWLYHVIIIKDEHSNQRKLEFSSDLGELTEYDFEHRINELYVGKTNNGKYYIYDADPMPAKKEIHF